VTHLLFSLSGRHMAGLFCELIVKPIACYAAERRVNIDAAAAGHTIMGPRVIRNMVQIIQQAAGDLSSHIWIGKRSIEGVPVGITIIPGHDGFHWAILVNGYLYHINGEGTPETTFMYHEDADTHDSDEANKYDWFRLNCSFDEGIMGREQLCREVDAYWQDEAYSVLTHNCQHVVRDILAIAVGCSSERAMWIISIHVGCAVL